MARRSGRLPRVAILWACLTLVYAWSEAVFAQTEPVPSDVGLRGEGSAATDGDAAAAHRGAPLYAQNDPVPSELGMRDEGSAATGGERVSPDDAAADDRLQRVLIELQDLLRASRWSEALELVRASELDAADALALRGFVLLQSNAPGPAREAFLGALDERPERLGIWLYVAQCSVALGDSSAALTAYERGLVAGRDVPAVWVLGAQIELQSGNLFRAWDVLTAAEQRFGALPDATVLRAQVLSVLDLRWTMLPWQLTHTQRSSDACAWWASARARDAAVGTPGQGLVYATPDEGLAWAWQGSTGVWTTLCDPILRQGGAFDAEHAVLQGGADTSAGARLLRLAQSGECERALALASVYPGEVSAEAQAWLNWCASPE